MAAAMGAGLLAGLLMWAAIPAIPAQAAGATAAGPITLADYAGRLESARRLAEADAVSPSSPSMDAVRGALGLPVDVSVGGTLIHLSIDPDLAALNGNRADDFRQAADKLAALEDAARAALAAPAPDRPRMAAALSSAFRGINTKPGFLARIRHDLYVIWLSLLQRLTSLGHRLHIPSFVLVPLALAVVALVVVVVVRRLRYVVPERGSRSHAGSRARRTDWNRLAEEALARGDLQAALRARYGALLAALASRGVIPEAPSLTAGECRQAVAAGLPGAYPAVERATSLFEAAFFGRAPVRRGEVDALAEAEQIVRVA